MALICVVLGARAGSAEASADQANELVRGLAQEVWILFKADLDQAERVEQLTRLIAARTNVDLLSRLALGRHWRDLGNGQRARYQELFGSVVMRTLALRLDRYAKDASGSVEDHIRITGSSPVGKQDLLVRSTVKPATGEPAAVDWRLREQDGQLAIIDLIIEGVSLLVSQRSEFAAVIEQSTIDGLLAELEARAHQASPEPPRS